MAFYKKDYELEFGELQGIAPGNVPAYSNGSDDFFSGERAFDGEIQTGFKYQCVEFARRWLLERKGLFLPDVSWAVHIFEMEHVENAADGEEVRMVAVKNGSTHKPTADTLIIYPSLPDNIVGHVGAIVEAAEDGSWIRIADQNNHFHKWPSHYSEQLEVKIEGEGDSKTYTIHDHEGRVPLGWMTFPDTPNRDPSVPLAFAAKHKRPTFPPYELQRKTFKPKQPDGPWLDAQVPYLKKFIDTFGLDFNRSRMDEAESNYYTMNMELMMACVRAGTTCHKMMMAATEKVINSDELLQRFGIDVCFWDRIRHSWRTQKQAISGRFDFVVNEDGSQLKMLEYNADSASTLLECGVVQDKYAEAVGIAEGSRSSGFRLKGLMEKAWADAVASGQAPKGKKICFCVDDDNEEQYTALFMMSGAEAAGLKPRLYVLFDKFQWKGGKVCDEDGDPVELVWKTWAWESAITDYHKALEERGHGWAPKDGDKVRLCDLLLGDDYGLHVFEPMWKLIPSNKAILPIVWEMNKGNEFLLRTEWEVDDDLRRSGYVQKPIVGRTGMNITIVKPGGDVAAASQGKFSDRNMIYQELFNLPKRDDYFAILGGWMLGAYYGGTGLREDKTIITNVESPYSAIRIPMPKPPPKPQAKAE